MGTPVDNHRGRIAVGPHTFHIPVMGTGFTIDSPVRVAKYGISSVVSIVDDFLIEQMRKFHAEKAGEPYQEISHREEDSRARRITAYLNLLHRIVQTQTAQVRTSPFEAGSEIVRYFELLPEGLLRSEYLRMVATQEPGEKRSLQDLLRKSVVAGSIDVNIMTKLDREVYRRGEKLPPEYRDAMAALRGFAKSDLSSGIVFSAGMNQRLYGYAAEFPDFLPDTSGNLKKKIILKVSDYRSAEIQGKFLAKRGLWVWEYRIESGLNCGGHAFATKGHLLGPILAEFKEKRTELAESLFPTYRKALEERGAPCPENHPDVRVTVQGGIGTYDEDRLMLDWYQVDATGWGTPFLLVPEVCNVDEDHLHKLAAAGEDDVCLSESSPLGIPFWILKTSASEENKKRMIAEGHPGSPCPKQFLVSNTEFTSEPVCLGAHSYQKKKLENLPNENLEPGQQCWAESYVLGKTCLCRDLSGGVLMRNEIEKDIPTAVCCGPNIVNFSKIASLEEMVGHIYGRLSLLANPNRPHMFIRELSLYVDYLRRELGKYALKVSPVTPKYLEEFKETMLSGVQYYRDLAEKVVETQRAAFLEQLETLRIEIEETLLIPEMA